MNKAKFKLWFHENWLRWTIVLIVVVTIVTTVAGTYVYIFQLESFQKQTMMASAPLYLFASVISAVVFVFCYRFMFSGGMAKMTASLAKPEAVSI